MTKDPGFDLGFEEDGSPRPRYLGRLTNNCSILDLEGQMPAEGMAPEEPEVLDARSFPAFRRKMEEAILSGKNKNRVAKDRKKTERVELKRSWFSQLKRSQRYLGLRPRTLADKDTSLIDMNLSWEETKKAQEAYESAAGLRLPQLDEAAPAPYPFDRSIVFICVDVEAYEHDQKKITEIGISTFDSLDIVQVPPGKGGTNWTSHLRCRHFRIVENSHLNNIDFISGCADKFETKFGTSEWISIKEAPQIVAACFRPPFSQPGHYKPYPAELHDSTLKNSNNETLHAGEDLAKRDIVLVGHDIRSDIEYLRSIGYDLSNLSNIIEAIDTASLYRAMKYEQSPTNLGRVLLDFGIAGWNLHNAVSRTSP